jgi:hypothetical protein
MGLLPVAPESRAGAAPHYKQSTTNLGAAHNRIEPLLRRGVEMLPVVLARPRAFLIARKTPLNDHLPRRTAVTASVPPPIPTFVKAASAWSADASFF